MILTQQSYLELLEEIDFEKIKDHPNILIAARFWDYDRYCAAKTCYKFMRSIDDLIDNHKANYKAISDTEKGRFLSDIDHWINVIKNVNPCNPMQEELTDTLTGFKIPLWPLQNFAKAMVYDIHNDGFPTLKAFLNYAEGASVAPAAIFVHLCGISHRNGSYDQPSFNVADVARPCAIFSYLVHIIRDFQKDQNNNLSYFADDLILKYGLSREILKEFAKKGNVDGRFRDMIKEYYHLADQYSKDTYEMIVKVKPFLTPKYQLSLEIIYNLYLMVFERIDLVNGKFSADELNPTADEIKERVYNTILNFSAA
ncbi:MAG: squalene/phytoene synthase family protein [Bacteroidales bacterium]